MSRGWITFDGAEVVQMPSLYGWILDAAERQGAIQPERAVSDYDALFEGGSFGKTVFHYLECSIEELLVSESVLERALAMLDRRVGKRRLEELDVGKEHPLVQLFFLFRCEAEGIDKLKKKCEVPTADFTEAPYPWTRSGETRSERAKTRLKKSNQTRKIRPLLRKLYEGELAKDDLDNAFVRDLYSTFSETSDSQGLYQGLLFLDSTSGLLKDQTILIGLLALLERRAEWLRPLESWIPKSHNVHRQFSSLASYLFAVHSVPRFMEEAWLSNNALHQDWYIALGSGKNIRSCSDLPISLSGKMVPYFLKAPDDYTVNAALRWAQLLSLGGDKRLTDAVCETRLVDDFRDEAFWLSFFRFLVANPMLDTAQIAPIIDYIWNRRYEPQHVFVEEGIVEEQGPAQPGFSMRGRTVVSLLRAVHQWHRALGREVVAGKLKWTECGIRGFRYVEGARKEKNMRIWTIEENLSSNALIEEGRELKHCVASYGSSCAAGRCSIWSMKLRTDSKTARQITIEVMNETREIRQARGFCNRRANDKEREILGRWAEEQELTLAAYIYTRGQ